MFHASGTPPGASGVQTHRFEERLLRRSVSVNVVFKHRWSLGGPSGQRFLGGVRWAPPGA
eukprot:8171359-Alexandrium_andersonii.AAC.1